MSTLKEIVEAIRHLSPAEREMLEELLLTEGDDAWDRQIKSDAQAGKLDDLAARAIADVKSGKAKSWP